MITIEIAIELHNDLIDLFGGSKGVRDKSGLEAAIARPYMTFDQQELILLDYGFHLGVTENEQYDFVIAASTGQIRFDEIKAWLQTNTSPIS